MLHNSSSSQKPICTHLELRSNNICRTVGEYETLSDKMSSNMRQAQHASRSDKTGLVYFGL